MLPLRSLLIRLQLPSWRRATTPVLSQPLHLLSPPMHPPRRAPALATTKHKPKLQRSSRPSMPRPLHQRRRFTRLSPLLSTPTSTLLRPRAPLSPRRRASRLQRLSRPRSTRQARLRRRFTRLYTMRRPLLSLLRPRPPLLRAPRARFRFPTLPRAAQSLSSREQTVLFRWRPSTQRRPSAAAGPSLSTVERRECTTTRHSATSCT
ncbi:hypothetical protein BCR35DRAFT_301958 [Leucosporidium creatinivorum]|uniref:Uncharacterized protein n=1 Tax=Leucosporidium creatinivorum TaxID=106004 RepID=A0A1Y2FVL5_9BASI|nr:hypothetical protein BCR35DRAFT_301958 [Leucosporidium creatinivorum]